MGEVAETMSRGRQRRRAVMFALALAAPAAGAQQVPPAASSGAAGPLAVQAGVDTYTAYYAMRGAWWNLAAETAPSFDADRSFGEVWLHPKASATHALGGAQQAYGALSVGITRTIGADAFDEDGQGAVRFENAHLGLRGSTDGGWSHDLSFGRQPFTLGTGMLLTAGSSNGGSWGGAASTPRKAWGRSVLARVGHGELTGQAFVLEPSESPEVKTDTRVQGVSIEWAREQSGKAGLAWLTVPKSNAVYPGDLAPLAFIEDGRNGLDTWHGWANVAGLVPGLPALSLRAEFAVQSNDVTRVDGSTDPMRAEAWLIGVGYQARSLPFAPRFRYHLARFSGDKPGTDTYERFDPMFWGNGLDNWWFGANGAYAWLNSNIRAHRFIVDAYASVQDILQFQFIRASADQLGSAIQYGQGARFDGSPLVVGVPAEALADEYYLQWAHVFTPTLVAVAFVSRSLPGDGLKAVAPQGSSSWTTFGLGLTANF